MKLKQPHSGSPRPFATWYFRRENKTGVPDRIGHAASRIGAVKAAVTKLRISDLEDRMGATAEYVWVEIYDEDGLLCNNVRRTRKQVLIEGYY